MHPLYDPNTYDYDFSILEFENTIKFTSVIKSAKLVAADVTFPVGSSCLISGFVFLDFALKTLISF
jgi:Trypsin